MLQRLQDIGGKKSMNRIYKAFENKKAFIGFLTAGDPVIDKTVDYILDMEQVEINVLQGERPLAKDNQSLGKFKLKKIKRAMRGVPQIEVTFDIDSNGIVHVSAKDLASGNSQSMTIEGSSKMSDSDIEEAIRQAKMYESQDQVTKDNMLLKNEVETLIINVQNGLASHKKEMDKALRKQIKAELSSLMKMTRKFNYETASSKEIQKIKDSKNHLESLAQNIIGR